MLALLAHHPGTAYSSTAMAESTGSSPVHLRRVLGALRRAGLVTSRPGATGGWQLTAPAEAISLRDVWDAVNGESPVLAVHDAAPGCDIGQSVLQELGQVEHDLAEALAAELGRRTLADIAAATAPA